MNFDNFHSIDPEVRNLVSGWHERSRQGSHIERFVYLWMAFNGWAMCITDADRDGQMIQILREEPRLRNAFDVLQGNNDNFRTTLNRFSEWWPIYDARKYRKAVRKSENRGFHPQDRERLHEFAKANNISGSPEGWLNRNAPQWNDFLTVVYKVRCNLFHGQKDTNNEMDREIVGMTYNLFSSFIDSSGCYNWTNN